MTLVQRTVTGIIKNALGENLAGAKIVFIPQKVFGAGNTTVPATRREVITGAGGEFSIALYTFDTGTVQYACLLPSKESFSFNLAAGASVNSEWYESQKRKIKTLEF